MDFRGIGQSDPGTLKVGAMNDVSDEFCKHSVIKIIGIGGGGINAINQMIEIGIRGAEFIAISSDTQELARSKTDHRLYLASAEKMPPAIGLSALIIAISEDDRARIKALISGADIIFIVAGMGGGSGTSIASIAAKISRDLEILTIGVVSMPCLYEGNRTRRADQGINELTEHADALVIVPNAMLVTEADMCVSDVFIAANHLMYAVVSGIAESVSDENLICLDIADLRMVFADAGMVAIGTANASGADRAQVACERTISGIFPSTINLAEARAILINITASSSLKLKEVAAIMEFVQDSAMDATVIAVAVENETMGDNLRVTLFATGHAPISVMETAT